MRTLLWFISITIVLSFLIFSCTKDEAPIDIADNISIKKPSDMNTELLVDVYHANSVDTLPVLVSELRSGREYPFFDITNAAILDNKYNEQYLFDKDDVATFTMTRLESETAAYNDTLVIGVFNVIVRFKDNTTFSFNGWATDQKDPRKRKNLYVITPTGFNYGKGVDNLIVFFRTKNIMSYYDFTFNTFKTKYEYIVYDKTYRILYKDYIPSRLEKSNVFLLKFSHLK